jgi:hypothetical protein
MSDGPRRGPYTFAKDLAIVAKNASAKLRLGRRSAGDDPPSHHDGYR